MLPSHHNYRCGQSERAYLFQHELIRGVKRGSEQMVMRFLRSTGSKVINFFRSNLGLSLSDIREPSYVSRAELTTINSLTLSLVLFRLDEKKSLTHFVFGNILFFTASNLPGAASPLILFLSANFLHI